MLNFSTKSRGDSHVHVDRQPDSPCGGALLQPDIAAASKLRRPLVCGPDTAAAAEIPAGGAVELPARRQAASPPRLGVRGGPFQRRRRADYRGGACLLYISGPGAGLAAWAAETAADSRPAGQGILPAAVSAAMVFLTGVSTFLIVGLSGLSPSAFSSPLELLLESARYLFGGAGLSLAAGCLTALCFSAGLCACAYAEVGLSLLTPSRRGRTAVRLCCLSSLLAGALSPEPAPWTIFLCPLVPLVLLRTAAVLRRCGDAIPKYPFKNP